VDVHHHLLAGALDHDLRDAGVEQLLLDEAADPDVLVELGGVAALREPVGLPPVEGADPESVRMDLLSHRSALPEDERVVARPLLDPVRPPLRTRADAPRARPLVDPDLGDHEVVDVDAPLLALDRQSTRLNSSHVKISY